MTKMFIEPSRPGVIRWDDDPLTGILAGLRAAEIVEAVNAHDEMKAEIARVQEAKRKALEIADERSKENVGLRAEVKRLRAALRAIYPAARSTMPDDHPDLVEARTAHGVDEAVGQ